MKKPTKRHVKSWEKWLSGRPPTIREMGEKMPPWAMFSMKETDQIVSVIGYNENGTVRVYVHDDPRPGGFTGFEVFGVDPASLTPAN